jgi:hypothetical protein
VKFFDTPEKMCDLMESDFVESINKDFPLDRVQTVLQARRPAPFGSQRALATS